MKDTKAYLAFRQRRRKFDFILIAAVFALCVFGLIVLSSATLSFHNDAHLKRQMFATALGVFFMFVMMFIDFRVWKRLYLLIYIVSIGLLTATLIFGHGETTWGSRSWLKIGPLNFQPAEFVKIGVIISLSTFMEKIEDINKPFSLIKLLIFAFIPVALILRQPDMGTAMVFVFIIACMLFFGNISCKYILCAIGGVLVSLPIVYTFLDPYQKDRILDFLDPAANTSGSGYQYNEGKIAIGSGKITGKGLYHGSQTQFNFIPTKETDSIFPVLVEELGFIGGFGLLALYGILLYRMLEIARQSKDLMGSYMTIGILAMFLVHIWENIGMTLGLMPITGIPLPFMSFGGTFQLVNLVSIGLILSVKYHRKTDGN
ncbi:MAG: rod shape-determining protein RodA [Tissierellia bacterium]|nr:rod shape-determining protein RodA [Tissierellia bacterium]